MATGMTSVGQKEVDEKSRGRSGVDRVKEMSELCDKQSTPLSDGEVPPELLGIIITGHQQTQGHVRTFWKQKVPVIAKAKTRALLPRELYISLTGLR